ncbi:cold shock domain-containing protein [Hymenobacter lutimineralis]|uniref:Cold shock domain-containing protein n=1 Tax=Hymenobacter lutimineralis TaxID=2606448 RepID=A0A5D6V1A3_9BACT|nr:MULTISPECIES: cold shock domain-containing protein [Hymenobacter]QIX61779.1 cold shock domain-containing protein [Hymenobacter sp. BT18]TYZ09326.1 cold shock domain-containing protein [Hymenobacter lutimineralis]
MARSQATFGKKENEKKRLKKRNDKAEKKEERQANAKKGQNLEDMLAYVDDDGNITSTPPDPTKKKKEIKVEDIRINVMKQEDMAPEDPIRKGVVSFFNDSKGYGFIKDQQTQESIFVHANNLINQIKENDKVSFEVEMGPKGPAAVRVKLES